MEFNFDYLVWLVFFGHLQYSFWCPFSVLCIFHNPQGPLPLVSLRSLRLFRVLRVLQGPLGSFSVFQLVKVSFIIIQCRLKCTSECSVLWCPLVSFGVLWCPLVSFSAVLRVLVRQCLVICNILLLLLYFSRGHTQIRIYLVLFESETLSEDKEYHALLYDK